MATKSDMDCLRIGDFITLRNAKLDCYMCGEGILVEDVVVTDTTDLFEDALFCIQLQRQYSAARELEEFLDLCASEGGMKSHTTEKYFNVLKRGRDNENKLNDTYMAQRISNPVHFGDIVQLLHVKSGKYLTIVPDKLARDERENIYVSLVERGNPFSWIQLLPRFKIDKEGDQVVTGASALLRVAERPNEYIHCSDKPPRPGYFREVNCSLEMTTWRLNLFQNSKETFDSVHLTTSQLVYIHDPETRSNVTAFSYTSDSGEEESIALRTVASNGDDTNALWMIESRTVVQGGVIQWKSDQIRFRNLNTGQYLQLVQNLLADGGIEYTLALADECNAPGTLFQAHELYSTGIYLSNGKPLQLSQAGIWFRRGEYQESNDIFACRGSPDRTSACSLLINRYVKANPHADNELPSLIQEPLDVFVGIAAKRYLRKYSELLQVPQDFSIGTIFPSSDNTAVISFCSILNKLLLFVRGIKIDQNLGGGVDGSGGSVVVTPAVKLQRQAMMLEQGVINTLLEILEKLIPISVRTDTTVVGIGSSAKASSGNDQEKALIRMGLLVLKQCLELLYYAITGHMQNQIVVADFMPILLAHVGAQPLAAKCVGEMLSTNIELQETKIGPREIQIFTDKLRSSKMNSMYLNLLKACCSCMGKGIDGNQCTVAEVVFEDINDIIIQVHSDNSHMWKAEWDSNNVGLYIPRASDPNAPVNGMELVSRGIPELSLSWTTTSMEFSPLGLFGKLSVAITDLYKPKRKLGNVILMEEEKVTAASIQKQAVADYFIAELFLAAEMCLDRNYIAMERLDKLFSYSMLVAMLKVNVNDVLKSAAVNLILRLYVDRDPQVITNIPCLTRTWDDISKSELPRLPSVEPSRQNHFALLQQYISEHIREMQGNQWDSTSFHLMQLLYQLVVFNFYGSNEKLRDVYEPLIVALDRRSVDIEYDDTSSFMSATRTTRRKRKLSRSLSKPVSIEDSATKEEAKVEDVTPMDVMQSSIADEVIEHSWQKAVLDFLESLTAMTFILLLVFVAIAVTIYQSISGVTNDGYRGFDIVVVAIFVIEITLRFYCYVFVHREYSSFFKSFLNIVDIAVVIIDLVVLGSPSMSGGGAQYAKALRAVRLIRLVRLFRAARLVQKLADMGVVAFDAWKCPARYLKTPKHELQTMVKAVEVLSYVQRIIEDRNVSLLLYSFCNWEKGEDTRTPSELFEQVIEDSADLSIGVESFDDIFIDLLMYADTSLVQVCLDVIMAQHSSRQLLFENIQNVQLLVHPDKQAQFKEIEKMLLQLGSNAETHELWGELESEDDRRINEQTIEILEKLISYCRVPRTVLEFDESFQPDPDVQDLMRNLGFFEICFKVLGLIPPSQIKPGEELDEVTANTIHLISLTNVVLYWFLYDNPLNQELGFGELEFFLSSLDMGIKSHRIIRAIFQNNDTLMKLCPRRLIEEYSEKVCKSGRQPQYLAILASVTHVRDRNIIDNQYEIVKHLMAPGRLRKMVRYFCGKDNPEYAERLALMEPYLDHKDIGIDELPTELAYHLEILKVLSGCTVGRTNITTVEAKVQSVYDYEDVVDAIVDPGTILIAKIRLGLFFFNTMIDVEMLVPGLGRSAKVWHYIESTTQIFSAAVDDLRAVRREGWERSGVPRQKIEYMVVCAMNVSGFLSRYFDASQYDLGANRDDKNTLTFGMIQSILVALYKEVRYVAALKSKILSKQQNGYLKNAADILRSFAMSRKNANIAEDENAMTSFEDTEDIYSRSIDSSSVDAPESSEAIMEARFTEFRELIKNDPDAQFKIKYENQDFVQRIEALPLLSDNMLADVRYEPFIKKLVQHTRDCLIHSGTEKQLNKQCTQTTTWIIRAFRNMIENRWKMTIYERDDDGGEEEDEAAGPVMEALNNCGATTLCLDLISVGIDESLMLESVKLCVALLFKEGGNLSIQKTMYNHLTKNNSELFFRQLRATLQKLISFHKWGDVVILKDGEEPDLPEDVVVVRFMQLMCEGHYGANQDIMRDQPNNPVSINLLDDLVAFLNCLSRIPCRTSTDAAIRVSATILEVIQGPCENNQEHFALNTELIETLNRIMRAKLTLDCVAEEEFELKKTCVDIFQGLLEGQGRKSVVYDRVLSVIHLDVIQMMCLPTEESEENEEARMLQTECMVLIQMFCDYKPSLRKDLEFVKDAADIVGTGVACVEILWRGELQRRFFHIPKICNDLAKAAKDNLVEHVDRSSQENKLLDFMNRSHELYREIKHQQVLKYYRVSGLFSRSNQDKATWLSLLLACVINGILLGYYTFEDNTPKLPPDINTIVNALNIFQIGFSGFTLLLFLIVRVPVKYQSNVAAGYNRLQNVFYTATDPLTMYYFVYLLFSVLGVTFSDIFLTFLMLDIIVKNSTARDVLYAVIYPRKQLAMTMVLSIFVVYIFSFVYFLMYRDDFADESRMDSCRTLYKCFKVVLGNGLRAQGGIGEMLVTSLGDRYVVDLLFYLVVLIVLLNVIFGIIIDTFGDLRTKKAERHADTTEKCFICGIDKQEFDRTTTTQDGFKNHIKLDHNMWNYLYFIIYIWEQDKDDDDGLEQYVRRALDANDISWFPMNRAMRLSQAESSEEELRKELKEYSETAEVKMLARMVQIQTDITTVLGQVAADLEEDEVKSESNMLSPQKSFQTVADPHEGAASVAGSDAMSMSQSLVDDATETSLHANWKKVFLRVVDIQGLDVPEKELMQISCRIISEAGMFSAQATQIAPDRLIMDGTDIMVCERSRLDDTRTCRIQIVKGSGRVAQFLAVVDVSYEELIAASDLIYEKTFTQAGQTKTCVLSVYSSATEPSDEDSVSIYDGNKKLP